MLQLARKGFMVNIELNLTFESAIQTLKDTMDQLDLFLSFFFFFFTNGYTEKSTRMETMPFTRLKILHQILFQFHEKQE